MGWYIEYNLLSSFVDNMFKKRIRVNLLTFEYLCTILERVLKLKNDTNMRNNILIHTRVALTLAWLGSSNILIMCGDLYGITHNTTSIIIKECFETIKNHVRFLVFEKPTLAHIKKNASEFEHLGTPYVWGTIDRSYIPIIASSWDPASYYCRKWFYSALLQGVVDA